MLRFGIESLDDLPILDATKFAEIESEVEKELTETLGEPVFIDKNAYATNTTESGGDSEEVNLETEEVLSDVTNTHQNTKTKEAPR